MTFQLDCRPDFIPGEPYLLRGRFVLSPLPGAYVRAVETAGKREENACWLIYPIWRRLAEIYTRLEKQFVEGSYVRRVFSKQKETEEWVATNVMFMMAELIFFYRECIVFSLPTSSQEIRPHFHLKPRPSSSTSYISTKAFCWLNSYRNLDVLTILQWIYFTSMWYTVNKTPSFI